MIEQTEQQKLHGAFSHAFRTMDSWLAQNLLGILSIRLLEIQTDSQGLRTEADFHALGDTEASALRRYLEDEVVKGFPSLS